MSAPRISVILCVRDGEAYLSQALDSVAGQDYPNLEVIVVDDGSTDLSAAIAEAHTLPVVLHRQPAGGHGAALNTGVGAATGAFLTFIDADDVWTEHRLTRLMAVFARDPDAQIVHGAMVNCNSDLMPTAPPMRARLLGASLMRRNIIEDVGPFRTDVVHASNVDWIGRAVSHGVRFDGIDDVVVLRRVHGQNMGVTDRSGGVRDMLRVIRDHHARRKS